MAVLGANLGLIRIEALRADIYGAGRQAGIPFIFGKKRKNIEERFSILFKTKKAEILSNL